MHERVKRLRAALSMTQQTFADELGLKRNSIAQIESGLRNPSNSVVNNICKTFGVNEDWLRTGEGEMFAPEPKTVLEELTVSMGLSDFEMKFLDAYLQLDKKKRDLFCSCAMELAQSVTGAKKTKAEAMAEEHARILQEELDALKRDAEECSALPRTKKA